ncbi:DUF5984 family protein [Gottfriedia acidiceleris]|uniref:DUF5984 family protein n=1 Tax=Gottfriedia acidiceleris TaxID=371036 RepID=UPI003D1BD57D
MIKFLLKEIKEIEPWKENNQYFLHWFGLTDSYYWISIDENVELFRYSEEFIAKYGLNPSLPYVDYQCARLLWDIIELLDFVSVSIPSKVFEIIETIDKFESYLSTLSDWLENKWNETNEMYDEIYEVARQWIDLRRLDSEYLIGAPDIYFFRSEEKIYIRWFSEYKESDGTKMWTENKGEKVIEYDDLIRELNSTLIKFEKSMETQIDAALNTPPKNIYIDSKQLDKNQIQFKELIENIPMRLNFASKEEPDWEDVLNKINLIKAMN